MIESQELNGTEEASRPDDLLVVGGGISGLTLAWTVLQQRPGWRVRVLEAGERPGGTMRSDRVRDCVCEWGPNGFLTNVPHTWDLAHALGLGDRVRVAEDAAANRFLYVNHALRAISPNPGKFLTSDLLSVRGRLRVLLEPFQGRGKDSDESVFSFASRRIGPEAAAVLIDAMVSGIHAADPRELSLQAAFPRMAEMEREHGSLVRAMIALRRAKKRAGANTGGGGPAGPGGTLTSFDGGMEVLVQGLASKLGSRLVGGTEVESVIPAATGYRVTAKNGAIHQAKRVALATPAYVAQTQVAETWPRMAQVLGQIPYAGITVACLLYQRSQIGHGLDGFGFLVPRGQGPRILGCIWVGSIFPDHVAKDTVMLRVLLGGARDPEAAMLCESRTVDLAHKEVERILGGIEGTPTEARLFRHPRGIPQYVMGHPGRVEALERELESAPGLFLLGNAYRGIGVNDCVREAQALAGRILQNADAGEPLIAASISGEGS